MGGNLDNSGGSGRREGEKRSKGWRKEGMLQERREKRKREKNDILELSIQANPKLSPSLGLDSEKVHIYQI